MTSTFLSNHQSQNYDSISKNLEEILNYYGSYFNPLSVGLNGEFFYHLTVTPIDPITVIDPLNPSNNTTRTAF
jgi:hypothetical protein